jgi:hypothetical protein
MQRRLTSRLGFGILGLVLGILFMSGSLLLRGQNRTIQVKLPNIPKFPVSYPGAPIVHSLGVSAMKSSHSGAIPTFSGEDLRQFLASNDAPLGTKGMSNVTITRADCALTAGNVSDILHGKSFAVPADTPVCYAELRGDVTFPLPPSRRSGQPSSITFHKSFRVYDAKTGNILAVGAFD